MSIAVSERSKKILDIDTFNQENGIDLVGDFDLNCPHSRQYILRMCIRHAHGSFMIPEEIQWLKPLLDVCEEYQQKVIRIRHLCCYVTVRHGLVTSYSDDEWHTDGFSTKVSHIPEQNYIISNCFPTEYVKKAIKFPSEFNPLKHNVHKYIQNRIEDSDIRAVEPNKIYCLDPYNIHRRANVPLDAIRTFVRISYTPIEIMDDNNTKNPLLSMPKYNRDGVAIRNRLLDWDMLHKS